MLISVRSACLIYVQKQVKNSKKRGDSVAVTWYSKKSRRSCSKSFRLFKVTLISTNYLHYVRTLVLLKKCAEPDIIPVSFLISLDFSMRSKRTDRTTYSPDVDYNVRLCTSWSSTSKYSIILQPYYPRDSNLNFWLIHYERQVQRHMKVERDQEQTSFTPFCRI